MRMFSFFVVFAAFALSAQADEPVTSPYATGGEVKILDIGNFRTAYIHTFTNTDEVATFASTGKRDLNLRYLVVGAGGAGGGYYANSNYGGGGGGGGGVCEKEDVVFESGATWQILVGKGATKWAETAGASSISNGVVDVETVPGGGNGADASTSNHVATAGASGGGASRRTAIQYTGGLGTYTNSLFGVEFGPFNGAAAASSRAASGGGGASKNGTQNTSSANRGKGGEGLASDITGELLVYGAGGGGGGGANLGSSVFYQGGLGGSRAGNGGYYAAEDGGYSSSVADITKANYAERAVAATDAEANSGGGGGGALGIKDASRNGEGADGIVVIRYEVFESPCDGGDIITKTLKHGSTYTWVHQFTNTAKAAEFINRTGRDLKLRYLVVGAGGPGGNTYSGGSFYSGGGGGGGGGVCERKDIAFASDASWQVVVGKGGIIQTQPIGGTSAISNGVADVETVPGGGGGARGNAVSAKDGASGGGGSVSAKTAGKGTYTNSLFGVEYGPFNGGAGSSTAGNGGGGGGAGAAGSGAGSAATSADGGEGLSSDITGESLIYGSGGGGGWGCKRTPISNYRRGGLGGGRAGNGATYEIIDDGVTTNYFAATCAALNSGGGGGGGGGGPGRDPASVGGNQPTPGADGVVIFRYDFNENPQGLMLIVR